MEWPRNSPHRKQTWNKAEQKGEIIESKRNTAVNNCIDIILKAAASPSRPFGRLWRSSDLEYRLTVEYLWLFKYLHCTPISLRMTRRTILFYISQPKIDPGKAHIHCQVDLESKNRVNNTKESTTNILLLGTNRAGNFLGRTTICHLNQWWVRCVYVRLINDTFYRGTGMVTSEPQGLLLHLASQQSISSLHTLRHTAHCNTKGKCEN